MESLQGQKTESPAGNSTLDTLTLAKEVRDGQGPWEVEVSYGGEADLHRHMNSCTKNPGHLNFIPVDQFDKDHLPSDCREEILVDFIKAMAGLTARVSVKYVSEKRPKTVPGTDKPYPCYKHRGKNLMRVGTGWVRMVLKYPADSDNLTRCDCKECQNSPTPKTEFAHIHIYTAAHVVFDELEAAKTTCHLFFDRGLAPEHCDGVVTLSGMPLMWSMVEKDWCMMTYATHDQDLISMLDNKVELWKSIFQKLRIRYPTPVSNLETFLDQPGSAPETWRSLIIIVSHPHGCSKQVSLGHCAKREQTADGVTSYTYTTPTCSGSSGALVFVLGCTNALFYSRVLLFNHVHNGNCVDNKKLNYSSLGNG